MKSSFFISIILFMLPGNHCLQCYECAHLVADSGSTFLDRMLEGIRGWYDADCLDIPTAYRLKTCDPGQACVVFKAQAQVSLHLQGTIYTGLSTVVYRNCSPIADTPPGCGVDEEQYLGAVVKEMNHQSQYYMNLDDVDGLSVSNVTAEICYCDVEKCNDHVEIKASASCHACSYIKGKKKTRDQLAEIFPADYSNKCMNKPRSLGHIRCKEDNGCGSLLINLAGSSGSSKTVATMLTRGCFPKIQNPDLLAVDNNYCYSVAELEELPSVVTILEDYQNLTGVGLRVKDGVLCPCDESYGNDQIYKQLLKAGDKDAICATDCLNKPSGTYNKCGNCKQYYICNRDAEDESLRTLLKSCRGRKYWDNKKKKCVKKSQATTCS